METSNPLSTLENDDRVSALPNGFFSNLFLTWRSWWSGLSWFQRSYPALTISLYWFTLHSLHGLKSDQRIMGAAVLVLYYAGPRVKPLLNFIFPFILTGIVYDSQRHYADAIRGPIHVSQPYAFDRFFFGIPTQNGVLTPNEWWQLHTHPILDFITGFAYLGFFAIFILISGYFFFFVSKRGTRKMSAEKIAKGAPLMPWSFFWLNVLGYSTYYWYAAAPPWYVSLYGLGPAQMDVPANSAGCARFDLLFGTHFFSQMYGRAADVFGAVPSLHVAYPLLAVYFAFKYGTARVFCVCFYALMCFSAVYLNHHFVLDILWGSAYAMFVGWATFKVVDYQTERGRVHGVI